jgi:hydrogenase maturation protease
MFNSLDSGDAVGAPLLSSSDDPAAPAPSVIVGLGNEIAGDDGVGIHVARMLRHRLVETPGVDVVALPWAGLALLDVLRGRDRAAIVDCLTSGIHDPGTVVRLDEQGAAATGRSSGRLGRDPGDTAMRHQPKSHRLGFGGSVRLNSFHDIGFPTAIALGRQMGWQMPDTVAIWGVEAERVDVFHEGLSPAVAAAVEPLIAQLLSFLSVEASLDATGVSP